MEHRASRRLGEARAHARAHLERHRGAAALERTVGLGEFAAQIGATSQRIEHLNRLGDVVQERVALGRAQAGLGGCNLRLLRERAPRCVDARQRAGEVGLPRLPAAGEQRRGMRHLVFLDLLASPIGIERDARIQEARPAAVGHRVAAFGHHGHHVALGGDNGNGETVEQVHHRAGELALGVQLVGHGQVLVTRWLVGEAAHHRGDRVDGAPAHQVAQLVAQRLQAQRLVEQLRVGLGKREHACHVQEVGRGEHEQVRRVVLQVAAVHQKLAQSARAVGDLHAEDALDGQDIGDHMACRADAAHAAGDIRHVGELAAHHHGLEQARRLHHVHLARFHRTVFDGQMHVAMALNAGDMVYRNGGPRHIDSPPIRAPTARVQPG